MLNHSRKSSRYEIFDFVKIGRPASVLWPQMQDTKLTILQESTTPLFKDHCSLHKIDAKTLSALDQMANFVCFKIALQDITLST